MNEQPSQEEIELRIRLEAFFVYVSELPMKEQIRLLREFQDFLAEQRKKQQNVSS
jgi:hypothetical protein